MLSHKFAKIKAVVFDFDGTLVDEEHWISGRWEKTIVFVEKELGIKNFGRVFHDVYEEKGPKYKYHVNDTLKKIGCDYMQISTIIDRFLNEKVEERLLPGVEECLQRLRNDYVLGIITNGKPYVQISRIKNAGIFEYFKVITYAYNDPKPSFTAFRDCLINLNFNPSEVVYVGNELETDMIPALEMGMHPVFYNPHLKPVNNVKIYQIRYLIELIELIAEM